MRPIFSPIGVPGFLQGFLYRTITIFFSGLLIACGPIALGQTYPSYGPEMRGGTANCTVAVSDEEIASPVASSPEFLIAMNQPSMVRFQNQIHR